MEQKALDQLYYERRRKRSGGEVRGESALIRAHSEEGDPTFDQIIGREWTPGFAAMMADELRRVLNMLGDAVLRSIAIWKIEGYINEEIAAKLDCVLRTVERKLRRIRGIWAKEIVP